MEIECGMLYGSNAVMPTWAVNLVQQQSSYWAISSKLAASRTGCFTYTYREFQTSPLHLNFLMRANNWMSCNKSVFPVEVFLRYWKTFISHPKIRIREGNSKILNTKSHQVAHHFNGLDNSRKCANVEEEGGTNLFH